MTTIYTNIAETLDQLRLRTARRDRTAETLEGHRTAIRNLVAEATELGATQDAIAATLGVTRQRIGQILGTDHA